jgi:3-methylfumaryl-CoA hydratase
MNEHRDRMQDSTFSPLIDADALAKLQAWQGRSETLADDITAAPVRALSATLDRDDAPPAAGTRLPELWHWLYFLPHHRQSEIGEDGHAKRGGFLPPVPLPRRMWAGGRLNWEAGNPLQVGDKIERTSTIASVTHKAGRTGELVFVLVRHEVRNERGLALTEEHDIVYRAAAAPGEKAPTPTPAPQDAAFSREIVPDDVLLFRYSALTFNGHRIHYDRRYVTAGRGLSGPDRARPADRDAAGRPAALQRAGRATRALRVPCRAADLRHRAVPRARQARGRQQRWQDLQPLGRRRRRLAHDAGHGRAGLRHSGTHT